MLSCRAVVVVLVMGGVSAALPAFGQNTVDRAVAPTKAPARVQTLDKALEQVPWEGAKRGPLLVVDPQNTRRFEPHRASGQRYTPPVPLPPPRADGYTLRMIAPHFDRKIVVAGSLTVLAPVHMVLLNSKPAKGNPLAGMRREEKLRHLMASLSEAQWRQIGSAQGLGGGDLAPEQRDVFASLVPDPLQVRKVTLNKSMQRVYNSTSDVTTLGAGQRGGARIRLSRSIQWLFPGASNSRWYQNFGPIDGRPEGTEFHVLSNESEFRSRPDAHGVTLRQEVPSRLKPGHIAFDAPALRVPVTLAGAKTVGDLIKRAAQASHVELYADPRVGTLAVWTRGTEVMAGDLLKALCLAITGTFRKVAPAGSQPAYVLTDDVEGIGTRRARLGEWSEELEARKYELQSSLRKQIKEQNPVQYLRFAEDEVATPGPETLRKIEADWGQGKNTGDYTMPVAQLPSAVQNLLREQTARHNEHNKSELVRTDQVQLEFQMRLSFIVPGVGAVDDRSSWFGSLAEFLPKPTAPAPRAARSPAPGPTKLPAALAARAVYVAPASAEEAARMAAEAAGRGLNQLWVEVPNQSHDKALLTAAIAAAKKHDLAVVAVIRLLQATKADLPEAVIDINLSGETAAGYLARRRTFPVLERIAWMRGLFGSGGDWLRVDVPETQAALKARLLDLAATLGLAGIVLRDTAAPGYADPGTGDDRFSDGFGTPDLGYTLAQRLAFLRQESVDPIDIVSSQSYVSGADLRLPFFQDEQRHYTFVDGRPVMQTGVQTAKQKWNAFRHAQNVRFLRDLHTALRAAHPRLPLFIRDRSDAWSLYGHAGWYGSWDKADVLPPQVRSYFHGEDPGPSLLQTARSQSRQVLLGIAYYPPRPHSQATPPTPLDTTARSPKRDPAQAFAAQVKSALDRDTGWDGVVLDLSRAPIDEAVGLLKGLASTRPSPTDTAKQTH